MVAYIGNQYFVKIGAFNVSAFVKSVSLSPSAATTITTRGNAAHQQRATALKDTSFSVTLGYEVGLAFLAAMVPGTTYTIEYGPEGNTSGKPRHVQAFILTGAPHEISVNKDEVVFSLDFEAADGPTVDMMAGGAF
jgi:hypothetical protein